MGEYTSPHAKPVWRRRPFHVTITRPSRTYTRGLRVTHAYRDGSPVRVDDATLRTFAGFVWFGEKMTVWVHRKRVTFW